MQTVWTAFPVFRTDDASVSIGKIRINHGLGIWPVDDDDYVGSERNFNSIYQAPDASPAWLTHSWMRQDEHELDFRELYENTIPTCIFTVNLFGILPITDETGSTSYAMMYVISIIYFTRSTGRHQQLKNWTRRHFPAIFTITHLTPHGSRGVK